MPLLSVSAALVRFLFFLVIGFLCVAQTALATPTQTTKASQSEKILFQYFQQQQQNIKDLQTALDELREQVFLLKKQNKAIQKTVNHVPSNPSTLLIDSTPSSLSYIKQSTDQTEINNTSSTTLTSKISLQPQLILPQDTTPTPSLTSTETRLYHRAFLLLSQKNIIEAQVLFIKQLSLFGDGEFAHKALFWLGEIYFLREDYQSALSSFQQLQNQFPDHPKQAETLYKLGGSLVKLERKQEAKKVWQKLIYSFPNASSARLAQQSLSSLE